MPSTPVISSSVISVKRVAIFFLRDSCGAGEGDSGVSSGAFAAAGAALFEEICMLPSRAFGI
ncbi:MAG: hypothetical protein IJK54_08360 [Clostridia bacterium]|nr:hypothetical protein [Clostridia bacterium]